MLVCILPSSTTLVSKLPCFLITVKILRTKQKNCCHAMDQLELTFELKRNESCWARSACTNGNNEYNHANESTSRDVWVELLSIKGTLWSLAHAPHTASDLFNFLDQLAIKKGLKTCHNMMYIKASIDLWQEMKLYRKILAVTRVDLQDKRRL